jgi:hypothetical protein
VSSAPSEAMPMVSHRLEHASPIKHCTCDTVNPAGMVLHECEHDRSPRAGVGRACVNGKVAVDLVRRTCVAYSASKGNRMRNSARQASGSGTGITACEADRAARTDLTESRERSAIHYDVHKGCEYAEVVHRSVD